MDAVEKIRLLVQEGWSIDEIEYLDRLTKGKRKTEYAKKLLRELR